MNKKELDILIARYFDADTSAEEERILLQELLSLREHDSASREALAVMGYIRTVPRQNPVKATRKTMAGKSFTIVAAAAVIIFLAVSISVALRIDRPVSDECLAYVAGERVDDTESIMRLMSAQLNEMGEASDNVKDIISSDLDDIRSALTE